METDIVSALERAAIVLSIATLVGLPYLAWIEGRVEAAVSRRMGYRVGWFGVLQPWADTVKLLSKSIPPAAGMNAIALAAFAPPLLILVAVPFSRSFPLADLHASLMYVVAVAGFAVHGPFLAAWVLRSDESLLAALQAIARSVSCLAALGLTLLAAAISYSSLRLSEIVTLQSPATGGVVSSLEAWGVAAQPLGFLIYLAVSISIVERGEEISRASAVHLLLLSGARRLQLIALAVVSVAIYLGAGHLPQGVGIPQVALFAGVLFALKTALVLFLMSLMRAAFSRFGISGFISFGWKLLVPAAALNLLITAASIAFGG